MEQLDDETLNEVIIGGIARLYESINFEFFHTKWYSGKDKVGNSIE